MQTAFSENLRHRLRMLRVIAGVALSSLSIFASCATGIDNSKREVTPAERIQRDQALGLEVARQFESHLKIKQDKEVSVYLHGLAQTLANTIPEMNGSTIAVQVTADKYGIWQDHSLPGHRIYLSSGLLHKIGYENELAAAIALELGHIQNRHVIIRIQEASLRKRKEMTEGSTSIGPPIAPQMDYPALEGLDSAQIGEAGHQEPLDYFSPTGIFAFPDEFIVAAAQTGAEILYRAGYDPRGMVLLWETYLSEPAHSPFETEVLNKLLEKTRRAVALQSPLRNPIVRSQAFLAIQKRMRKL